LQAPGNLKNILKKNKKPKLTDEEKERLDKSKKKSAVHNFLKQGEYKPDSKVRFVQRSDETLRQFKTRMHNECQNAISVVESTKSHNVVKDYMRAKKMDKNADKVERINAAEKKKRERLELLKQKKNDKRDEKSLAKAERAALVDRVEFGETVHAPPTFSRLPRGHEKTGKKFSNLLLLDKLKVEDHQVEDRQKMLEDERQKAIDAYRKIKGRERL